MSLGHEDEPAAWLAMVALIAFVVACLLGVGLGVWMLWRLAS